MLESEANAKIVSKPTNAAMIEKVSSQPAPKEVNDQATEQQKSVRSEQLDVDMKVSDQIGPLPNTMPPTMQENTQGRQLIKEMSQNV